MLLFSIVLFFLYYFSLLSILLKARPMPLVAAVPITFVAAIGVEAVFLNFLSLFNYVTELSLVSIHLAFIFTCLVWVLLNDGRRFIQSLVRRCFIAIKKMFTSTLFKMLLPCIILMIFAAILYPPNIWDSMTYHMARVAHWMQWQSVDYFPTSIERQNEMGPGAEYLILFFQILANSDYLAGFIQFLAFIVIPFSLVYFLRVFKIPRSTHLPILLLALTAPMAFLQAITTQNDLVCSIVTLVIIMAVVRLYAGDVRRIRRSDYCLLGISLAVGFLVKPIALIASGPFVLFGVLARIKELFNSNHIKYTIQGITIATVVFIVIAGPDAVRKIKHDVVRPEVYPITSNWDKDRLINPVRMANHSFPLVDKINHTLEKRGFKVDKYTNNLFAPNPDFIGNPIQLISLIIVSSLTILVLPVVAISRKKYGHVFLISVSPLAAWILFGLLIRDQPWITRLQMPLFLTLPFAFFLLLQIIRSSRRVVHYCSLALLIISGFSLMYSFHALAHNGAKGLNLKSFWQKQNSRESKYYVARPDLLKDHSLVSRLVQKGDCSRVGLIIGSDTWDYPLTWQVMLSGGETRHLVPGGEDNWSCLIYQKDIAHHIDTTRWTQTQNKQIWSRNLAASFKQSSNKCYEDFQGNGLSGMEERRDVEISAGDGYALLTVTGPDAQVLLPEPRCETEHSAILEVVIRSPYESYAELFYLSGDNRQYSAEQSSRKDLRAGENILHFFLPYDEIKGPMRLDLGTATGTYKIESIEIRSL